MEFKMNRKKLKEKLEKDLDKLEKEVYELEKEIHKTKEYKNTERSIQRAGDKKESLEREEKNLLENIREKYTYDGKEPFYGISTYRSKNINPEVIKSIKKVLGIKKITYLQPREVERITERLIEIEIGEDEGHKDKLKDIKKRIREWEERDEKYERKKEFLLKPATKLGNKRWRVENKLDEIHRQETSNTPKEIEWRITEKLQIKKGKELSKNFNGVVNKIRIEVIKEQIVNNLEDEED